MRRGKRLTIARVPSSLLKVRIKREDKLSRNLIAQIGLNPEMVEEISSATSVRNGAT